MITAGHRGSKNAIIEEKRKENPAPDPSVVAGLPHLRRPVLKCDAERLERG
jgi:hypothetical protein